MTNPIDDAFPATGTGTRADITNLLKLRSNFHCVSVTEMQGLDLTGHRRIFILSNGRTYEYSATETGADDGATILVDTAGNRFVWVGEQLGIGLPVGGISGDIAVKQSGTDGDVDWQPVNPRERLIASRTYYVRDNGNDSNSGLVNNSGGAFLTILKAWQTVCNDLDMGGQVVNIVCTGTFSAGIGQTALAPVGGGALYFTGDVATPANATINASTHIFWFTAALPCPVYIRGFKFSNTSNSAATISIEEAGTIYSGQNEWAGQPTGAVSYTHLTLPTTPYV